MILKIVFDYFYFIDDQILRNYIVSIERIYPKIIVEKSGMCRASVLSVTKNLSVDNHKFLKDF